MSEHVSRHLEILQHAMGLDQYGRGSAYRNHFVTATYGPDFDACTALSDGGFMEAHGPQGELTGGGCLFTVTVAGRQFIREHSPKPPKRTASQRRYERFLNADCGMRFGEWLKTPYAREVQS